MAKTSAADPSKAKTSAVAAVKGPAVESVQTEPVPSTSNADVPDLSQVTITGCLQGDGQTFWLKDTSGVDAPKSRSWRSGFLKKRSSTIDLVAMTSTLKLPNHVGERVAATGTLLNREMRVRSLRSVAASCD